MPGLPVKSAKYPPASWNCYGGLLDYTASPDLFPSGLLAWQRSLGLPLIVHARWVDVDSPYRDRYRITGLAATDPKYWDDRADYLKSQGVVTYVQDWLREHLRRLPPAGQHDLGGRRVHRQTWLAPAASGA